MCPESTKTPSIPSKKRKRSIRFVYLAAMSSTICASCMIGSPLQLFVLKLGASDFYLGLLTFSIMSLGFFLVFGISTVERIGKKKVMMIWWSISSVMLLPFVFFPSIASRWEHAHQYILIAIVALMLLRAFGEGMGNAGWFPLLQDNVPSRMTGKFFATFRTYWQSIGLISIWGIAFLLGKNSQWWKFSLLFGLGFIAIMVRATCVFFLSEKPPKPITEKQPSVLKRFKTSFSNPTRRRFLIYVGLYNIAATMMLPFQIKILKTLGYSEGYIIAATSMVSLGAILSLKFWGKLADRFGNRAVFSISHVGMMVAVIMWLLIDKNAFSAVMVFFLYFAWSVFNSGNSISQTRYMLHSVPSDQQGEIIIINTITYLAIAVAPLLGGLYLSLTEGLHFTSGALNLNNYHTLFVIATLLFIPPHLLRKKLRMGKEAPTSQVFTLVTRPLRQIFGPFVRLNMKQKQRKNSDSPKNS